MTELFKKLYFLVGKKFKKQLFALSIVVIFAAGLELLAVSVFMPILDIALQTENPEEVRAYRIISDITGISDFHKVLIILLVFTIAVYVLKNAYLSWKEAYVAKVSMEIRRYLSTRVMESFLYESYDYFLDKNTAEIIRSINGDSASIYEVVWNIITIISLAVTSLVIMVFLAVTNIMLTCVVAMLLGACALVILISVRKRTRRYGAENLDLNGKLIQYVKQAFEGIKEIKILNTEPFFLGEYNRVFQRQANITMKYRLLNSLPKYIIETVCIAGILFYMIIIILAGESFSTIVPQLAVFAVSAFRLLPYVNSIYVYSNAVMFYRPAVDTIYDELRDTNENKLLSVPKACEIKPLKYKKEIEIKSVVFSYQPGVKIMDGVSFSIKKGTSVAFIGPSGQGKTTMADLILGLLKPDSGRILVDGRDISEDSTGWHANIGYIPQFIYLSDDSIRRNVAYGIQDYDIDDDKVWKALEEAQLKEFVMSLGERLDTFVGERGMRLSGGQRQRIGIARALYRNPSFLVFDEATSALDNDTEREVMEAVNSLHGTKTMLIIAHRLSTIEGCDHVFEIKDTKVNQIR
ncbi:MAG: ABC transporter ATP-binding protein/permease [Lachnospiraceae bacterium]|nr:ABC transporter ATP-binding protein/permease [Lachnospiraceae bacterium]